ncbi:MAG: response regulator transcription factor [Elusimicrobiota bacterium]
MAHILIVDDDSTIQDLIKEVLSMQNHTFDTAERGSEALQKIRKSKFDLVILDRGLPEMDGIQVLKLLRASPGCAGLKVLMCTGAGMLADVDEALQAGASDYIVKPLDFAKLNSKVTALTTRKS